MQAHANIEPKGPLLHPELPPGTSPVLNVAPSVHGPATFLTFTPLHIPIGTMGSYFNYDTLSTFTFSQEIKSKWPSCHYLHHFKSSFQKRKGHKSIYKTAHSKEIDHKQTALSLVVVCYLHTLLNRLLLSSLDQVKFPIDICMSLKVALVDHPCSTQQDQSSETTQPSVSRSGYPDLKTVWYQRFSLPIIQLITIQSRIQLLYMKLINLVLYQRFQWTTFKLKFWKPFVLNICVGVITFFCLSIPTSHLYQLQNIFFAGINPGSSEPTVLEMNNMIFFL
ncbi:uncharacterized protein VP01_1111g4 [Puccinia sorghi]|uniref:Uncharacterized protein n=1 Tax=Puccinia sorghi TaxID=27349 RepID=A0A0L6VSK0_9BASI|nr:uncharacterized protein VP01_1111g4 [Puccinia sorghi]